MAFDSMQRSLGQEEQEAVRSCIERFFEEKADT